MMTQLKQFQKLKIDVRLYQIITHHLAEVELDLNENPKRYEVLNAKQKKELEKIIKGIQNTGQKGYWGDIKGRVIKSDLYKFVKKPDNKKKMDKLAKLLGTIAMMTL
jgi:hypothetical protein